MSNHVESLLSLSHVWQLPQAGAVEEERKPAAQKVRRAGSTCARWTVAEEQRLTEAVTELGERAWGDVAARINAENPARGRVAERSVSSVEQHWQVMTGRRQVGRPRQQSIAACCRRRRRRRSPACRRRRRQRRSSALAQRAPPRPPGERAGAGAGGGAGGDGAPTYPHQFTGTGEGEAAIPNGGVARAKSCAHWAPVDAPPPARSGRSRRRCSPARRREAEVEQREGRLAPDDEHRGWYGAAWRRGGGSGRRRGAPRRPPLRRRASRWTRRSRVGPQLLDRRMRRTDFVPR